MDTGSVRDALIGILSTIQSDSGYTPVPITGDTCPLNDLEGFDSKIWPVAITLLQSSIGITIPDNQNIFISANGRQRLTVDGIVGEVCKLVAIAA
jgi:hypothetical protein